MSEETALWIACTCIVIGFFGDAYYRLKTFFKKIYDEGEEE
jgi:hypothetical protein